LVYRAKKLLRRYRGPVLAATGVLLALLRGVAGITAGYLRAEQARQDAEAAQLAEAERAEGEKQAREQAQAGEQLAAQRRAALQEQQQRTQASERKAVQEKRLADAVRTFLQTKLLGQANIDNQADAQLARGGAAGAQCHRPRAARPCRPAGPGGMPPTELKSSEGHILWVWKRAGK
jgi:hypothetical protein